MAIAANELQIQGLFGRDFKPLVSQIGSARLALLDRFGDMSAPDMAKVMLRSLGADCTNQDLQEAVRNFQMQQDYLSSLGVRKIPGLIVLHRGSERIYTNKNAIRVILMLK